MDINYILILVYFVCICAFNICIVQSEDCATPEGKIGECLIIHDCPKAYNLLANKPVPEDILVYLRKLTCGFLGKLPKVCCDITAEIPRVADTEKDIFPSRTVCGRQEQDKIFGGEGTAIGEFTWMALLEYQRPHGKRISCGGSLITNRYILTAAHCLLRIPETWKLLSVRLGEHNLETEEDCEVDTEGFKECSDDPIDIPVEKEIPHELYDPKDPSQTHDIALLRLSREVEFTDFIQPICLPLTQRLKNEYYIGQTMTVIGWGRTETRSQSDIKLKVDIPIRSKSDCAPMYRKYGVTLKSSQVCAGGIDSKDACGGDSGGPLIILDKTETEHNYIEYGIVSLGPIACGVKNLPGVYTRVADYIDWIRAHIEP
ncbi:hypothetical protein ILUMI_00878 [Ignelater luminosus]|uniref:CLIP domain-containing serine protease n=1 Tax=Ignelater luminosus TaxID=2038154 RepID=A0A8K0DJJ5_IGNLU|nr:hypothetical protein ILUMI_00878 [Ignelater luminosus]